MKQQTLQETLLKSNKKNKNKTQNEENNQQNIKTQQKSQQKEKSNASKPSKNKKQVPKVVPNVPTKKTKKINKQDESSQYNKTKALKNQKKQKPTLSKGKAKLQPEGGQKQKEITLGSNQKRKNNIISYRVEQKKDQKAKILSIQNKRSKRKSRQNGQKPLVEEHVKSVEKQKQKIIIESMIQDQANVESFNEVKKQGKEQKNEDKKIESAPKQEMTKKRGGRWRKKEQEAIQQIQQVKLKEKEHEISPEMNLQNIAVAQDNKKSNKFSTNLKMQSEGQTGFRRSSRRMKIQQQKEEVKMAQEKNQEVGNEIMEQEGQKSEKIQVKAQVEKEQQQKQKEQQQRQILKKETKKKPAVKNRNRSQKGKKVIREQKEENLQEKVEIKKSDENIMNEVNQQHHDEIGQKDDEEEGKGERQREGGEPIQQLKETNHVIVKKRLIKKSVPVKKEGQSGRLLSEYLKFSSEGLQQEELFTLKPLIFDKFSNEEHYDTLIDQINLFQKQRKLTK